MFVALKVTVFSGRPTAFSSISIPTIVPDNKLGCKYPLSILVPVSEFTIIIFGSEIYPDPPFVTETIPIVLAFSISIIGDINASGCNVGSEEYS